jgi:hypothetical protein
MSWVRGRSFGNERCVYRWDLIMNFFVLFMDFVGDDKGECVYLLSLLVIVITAYNIFD